MLEQHKSMLVQGPERVLRMRALVFLAICFAVLPDALVTTWVAVAVAIRFAELLEVFVSGCASGCLAGAVFSPFLVMTGLARRLVTFDFAGCLVDLLETTTVLLVDRALALLPRRRSPTKCCFQCPQDARTFDWKEERENQKKERNPERQQ